MSAPLPTTNELAIRRSAGSIKPPRMSGVALLIILVLLYEIRIVLLPFVIPAIVAFMLMPVIDYAAHRLHMHKRIVAILTFIILCAIIGFACFLAFPTILRQAEHLARDFQGQIERFIAVIGDNRLASMFGYHVDAKAAAQHLVDLLRQKLSDPSALAKIGTWLFGGFFGFTLALLLLFYFLVGGREIARKILWLVPPSQRRTTLRIWRRLDPALRRYFYGVVATVVYASSAAYVGLGLILHIHHAVALALATGTLEMIPVIGPAAAIVIAGLASVHYATSFGSIIGYAIYATVLRLSIDQFFGPLILGRAARVPPPLVIFSFLAGGILFGVVGVILAVPVALTIRSILEVNYERATGAWARSSRPAD